MDVTIGADPELFLKSQGNFISAHGLVQGSKKHPYPVDGGAVQVDGMALEININPSRTSEEFLTNLDKVMKQLRSMLPEELELAPEPVAYFSQKCFDETPEENKELGCDPDFNAYTGQVNPRPNRDSVLFRTGAGHIHMGFTEGQSNNPKHILDCRLVTLAMDYFVGLPLTFLEPENERKKLYGKAGAFRPKSYGVEYRTPSNYWLKSDKLKQYVFDQSEKAFTALTSGNLPRGLESHMVPQLTIDKGCRNNAYRWMETDPSAFGGMELIEELSHV